MKRFGMFLFCALLLAAFLPAFVARSEPQPGEPAARQVPARSIPAPATVSPELKKRTLAPIEALRAVEDVNPGSADEWQRIIDGVNQSAGPQNAALQKL